MSRGSARESRWRFSCGVGACAVARCMQRRCKPAAAATAAQTDERRGLHPAPASSAEGSGCNEQGTRRSYTAAARQSRTQRGGRARTAAESEALTASSFVTAQTALLQSSGLAAAFSEPPPSPHVRRSQYRRGRKHRSQRSRCKQRGHFRKAASEGRLRRHCDVRARRTGNADGVVRALTMLVLCCGLQEYHRKFLSHSVRPDGRSLPSSRPVIIAADSITSASGSSLVKVGNTSVVCALKLEVGRPFDTKPQDGRLAVEVHLGPLCSPKFKAGRATESAVALSQWLTNAIIRSVEFGQKAAQRLAAPFCFS